MASSERLSAEQQTLALFKSDPIAFVTYVLGVDHLEEWQKEFFIAVRDNPRVAVRSGHGVGKTFCLAAVCLWLLLFGGPEVKIPITAPSASQIEAGIWAEIGSWLRKMERRWPALAGQLIKTSDRISRVDAPDDAFCIVRTAAKERPEALAGIHAALVVFIVDEASGVDDSVYDAARGSMSTPGAKTILAGNPTRPRGYFFDCFGENVSGWYTLHVPCWKSSRVTQDFIDQIAREFGEESNEYRIRVAGDFPIAGEDVCIPRPLIESAIDRKADSRDAPVIWGLDPARFGSDRTTLAKRQGNKLLEHITSWIGKDNMQVVGLLLKEIDDTPEKQRPQEIIVDANGLGAGIVDRLKETGHRAIGVNTGERPQVDTKRFSRLRDELWWRCREWFGTHLASIPGDKELMFELSCPTYEYDSSEKIKVESKDHVKKRLKSKRSPDKADAFVLTFFNQSRSKGFYTRSINEQIAQDDWVV